MNIKHLKYYSLLHNLVFAGAIVAAMGCGSLVVFTKKVAEKEAYEQGINHGTIESLLDQPLSLLTQYQVVQSSVRKVDL
jgi:hypothetical protein